MGLYGNFQECLYHSILSVEVATWNLAHTAAVYIVQCGWLESKNLQNDDVTSTLYLVTIIRFLMKKYDHEKYACGTVIKHCMAGQEIL